MTPRRSTARRAGRGTGAVTLVRIAPNPIRLNDGPPPRPSSPRTSQRNPCADLRRARRRAAARDRGRRCDPRRRAEGRAATSARSSSSNPDSGGTRSSPPTRTWASSARASSSICAYRRASRASKARRRSKRCAGMTEPRPDAARHAAAARPRRTGVGLVHARSPTRASRSPSIRWSAPNCRRGSRPASRGRVSAQRADTLAFLADRCEGNLLAARQEIEKLGLLLPEGELAAEAVERAVTDVARYDVFQLSEAWLAGDAARALRIVAALEAEGEGIQLLLWQLGEDIHALASVLEASAAGTPVSAAVRNARVWGKRQAAMERAARRVAARSDHASRRGARAARRAVEGHRSRAASGTSCGQPHWRSPARPRCHCLREPDARSISGWARDRSSRAARTACRSSSVRRARRARPSASARRRAPSS